MMSKKIEDVLEVLAAMRAGFRADVSGSLKQARIGAIRSIAKKRGVSYQTVGDAYLRRLEPHIKGTPAFDRVTEDWLSRGSRALRDIIAKHALDADDIVNITRFFS
jgi:hypothetical protein